jgi:hypothetical protein
LWGNLWTICINSLNVFYSQQWNHQVLDFFFFHSPCLLIVYQTFYMFVIQLW